MTTKILRKKSGFSLVEMIIYVSLLSMITFVVVNTMLSFTGSYKSLRALRKLDHSSINAMERMTRDIRQSTSINSGSSYFGIDPGTLTLLSVSGAFSTTTKFYVQNNVLKVDVNGTYLGPLTVSGASVTSLVFSRSQSSVSNAVKIDMTISATDGGVVKTKTYHTTVILRGQ